MRKIVVEKRNTFSGHRDGVYALVQADQPYAFFSGAGDGMVVRWDLGQPDQGELIARVPASVYAVHYLASRNQLWIGQNFDGVHVIDLISKTEIASVKITASAIFDMASWDDTLVVATGEGMLVVMDIPTRAIRTHIKAADKSARCISVNPASHEFAVGYSDHRIRIFDMISLQVKAVIDAHQNSVFTVAYSPDGAYLLSGSRDAHLNVWAVHEKYRLHTSIVAHLYAINHIAFNPPGTLFLTGSMDKSIKVWDAATYQLLKVIDRARHAGHGTSVNKLLWTSYQDQLVSASDDRTLSAWQLHWV